MLIFAIILTPLFKYIKGSDRLTPVPNILTLSRILRTTIPDHVA